MLGWADTGSPKIPGPQAHLELAHGQHGGGQHPGDAPVRAQGLGLRPPQVPLLLHRQHPPLRLHGGERRDRVLARVPRADDRRGPEDRRRGRPVLEQGVRGGRAHPLDLGGGQAGQEGRPAAAPAGGAPRGHHDPGPEDVARRDAQPQRRAPHHAWLGVPGGLRRRGRGGGTWRFPADDRGNQSPVHPNYAARLHLPLAQQEFFLGRAKGRVEVRANFYDDEEFERTTADTYFDIRPQYGFDE